MTDPSQFGNAPDGTPPPPPGGYPPPYPPPGNDPRLYPQQPGGYQQGGYPPPSYDPSAPFGRHPATGEPLSDKSKTVGGLLQLLGIIGVLGIGRFYTGHTGLGVAQLLIGLFCAWGIGWLTCGLTWLVPLIWGIVDCVTLMNGTASDSAGRRLRDGG